MTLSGQFTYNYDDTPEVYGVTPNLLNVLGKSTHFGFSKMVMIEI